jgi:peptidoglycan/LPS O-acetylase OafA/YrhL
MLDFDNKISGPGHFWSLAVEEHFYLFWPLIIYFTPIKHLFKTIFIGVIIVFIIKFIMLKNGHCVNYFTLTRIDQLMFGAVLALLEKNKFFDKAISSKIMLKLGGGVFIILIFVFGLQSKFPMFKEILKYPMMGLFFMSILGYLIANQHSLPNKLLTSSVLQYLGKISFGIYIYHMFAIQLMERFWHTGNLILDLFLVILFTTIFAHLSYYYFELKFLKLKDKIKS